MKVKQTTLTPKYAQKLLDDRKKGNRPISAFVVKKYAREILENRWSDNGVPITLDDKGHMLDGQHRCSAVVFADRSIPIILVYDVTDKHAFATYDTGKARGLSDVLNMKNEGYYRAMASSLNLLHKYEGRTDAGLSKDRISNRAGLEILKKHPGLRESAAEAYGYLGHMPKRFMRASVLVTVHYLGCLLKPRKTDEFFTALSTGADLSEGSPILTLREKLFRIKRGEGLTIQEEEFAWVIKAWNAYVADETPKFIRWSRSARDKFPSLTAK